MVQTTFTKQKRALIKARAWIGRLRAEEVRVVKRSADGAVLTTERTSYVDFTPEEVVSNVTSIVCDVVRQHGARQRANATNTGRFRWHGVVADLTVPQLRALQEANVVLGELCAKLPRKNPHLVANDILDGRPAFKHAPVVHEERRTRYVPFEDVNSTRVRTYEESYTEVVGSEQRIVVDFGLDARQLTAAREMVDDLGTAIQCAIDEANTRGRTEDPVLAGVVDAVCAALSASVGQPGPADPP